MFSVIVWVGIVLQRKPFAFELFSVWQMRGSSHLTQKHVVTFQPSLYAYCCARICAWDVIETEQIFRRIFEFDYFRKTTQPFSI